MFKILGHADWVSDPKFATREGILGVRQEIAGELADWVAERTGAECDAILSKAGVPVSVYKTPEDIWQDSHSRARGSFHEVSDPMGPFEVLNTPFQISGADCAAQPFVSGVGQYTREVVVDLLGYSPADYDRLQAQKAFG